MGYRLSLIHLHQESRCSKASENAFETLTTSHCHLCQSMSSIPVHTGHWTDWSKGAILGSSLTVTDSQGKYIISTTSTFIGIVGTCAWSLVVYIIHQFRASRDGGNAFYHQQQVSLCNSGSAVGTAKELMQLHMAWSPKSKAEHAKRSTYGLVGSALIVWGAFKVASIMSSRIANPSFEASSVTVQQGNCGIWTFPPDNTTTKNQESQKILLDTLAGRAYARACYADDSSFRSVVSCNVYAGKSLPYSTRFLPNQCPFGSLRSISNQDQTFKGGPCDTVNNAGSFNMTTHLLDSHVHLGINARQRDRLQFSKSVVCSPLTVTNRTTGYSGTSCASGNCTAYNFGPIVPGVSDYTFLYSPSTPQDSVGYQAS